MTLACALTSPLSPPVDSDGAVPLSHGKRRMTLVCALTSPLSPPVDSDGAVPLSRGKRRMTLACALTSPLSPPVDERRGFALAREAPHDARLRTENGRLPWIRWMARFRPRAGDAA
jgi:hypothetical protein